MTRRPGRLLRVTAPSDFDDLSRNERNERVALLLRQARRIEDQNDPIRRRRQRLLEGAPRAGEPQAGSLSQGPPKGGPKTPRRTPRESHGPGSFRPLPAVLKDERGAPLLPGGANRGDVAASLPRTRRQRKADAVDLVGRIARAPTPAAIPVAPGTP